LRVVVDRELEGTKMSPRVADRALYDRKQCRGRRRNVGRLLEHDRDIEMVCEQPPGFDRGLVSPIDQDDAVTRQCDQRKVRCGNCRRREQRRHLRARIRTVARPARRLADVDEGDPAGAIADLIGELRSLLRAGDCQRAIRLCRVAEMIELCAAEMAKASDLAVGAPTPDRGRVEAHRVFTRADQDGLRWLLQVNPSASAAPTYGLAPFLHLV